MRVLSWKTFMLSAILTNLIIALVMWSYMDQQCDCSNIHRKHSSYVNTINAKHKKEQRSINETEIHLAEKITVIFRDFEFFENDLSSSIKSVLSVFPSVKIVIISDKSPYPPFDFEESFKNNIVLINLKPSFNTPLNLQNPMNVINTEHVIVFPDAVRLKNASQIKKILDLHYQDPNKIIAAPVEDSFSNCMALNVSLRYWTVKYGKTTQDCNALEGSFVLFITKSLLLHLNFPFNRPFLTAIFIQATILKIKTIIAKDVLFAKGQELFTDPHRKWKHDTLEQERKKELYHNFGIKKIIFPGSKVEWYGCSKSTNRCFGTVINNMPEYLFEGKWTPPCCMENLRQTARYVLSILDKCGVRHWLEGGSLLGAVRTADLIPWDYDVDIGIYKDDIQKCEWLKNSYKQSFIDTQGFLWEKATEGDFIRVQFSQSNHLHVDIFPFYSKNGTMTKDTWFSDHRQDCEFPEKFLNPMSFVKFVGVTAPAPNNYKEFLELKFGKGAIENPEYPNPKLMKFSRKSS